MNYLELELPQTLKEPLAIHNIRCALYYSWHNGSESGLFTWKSSPSEEATYLFENDCVCMHKDSIKYMIDYASNNFSIDNLSDLLQCPLKYKDLVSILQFKISVDNLTMKYERNSACIETYLLSNDCIPNKKYHTQTFDHNMDIEYQVL